jgi:Kef-type K+ transport system membrane component KefB
MFFLFVGGWEFLLSTMWKQGRLQNGDALVFNSVEILMSFFFVWYVCYY